MKLHVMISKLGLQELKEEIVYQFTAGRTSSSKLMSFNEARQLIMSLSKDDPRERMKGLIFSLAYKTGLIYGETDLDKKLNSIKLNGFLLERGAIKKELNKMTYDELAITRRQFQAMLKNTQKSDDLKQAKNLVDDLLQGLNITVNQPLTK